MKKNFTILLLLFIAHTSFAFQTTAQEWELIFEDDFNGNTIDQSKWTAKDNWPHTDVELQLYIKEDAYQENGNLVIRTQYNPTFYSPSNKTYNYTSGWIDTSFKFNFTHGKLESRLLLPKTGKRDNIWPAFWTKGNTESADWPHYGEIDVMEMDSWNDDWTPYIWGTYHWGPRRNDFCQGCGTIYPDKNFNLTEWHTYSVEWDEKKIDWFVDGVKYRTTYENQMFCKGCKGIVKLPTHPQFIIFNTAVDHFAPPNPADYPKYMYVDYVKLYQKKGSKSSF
ncbi:hypothetical protein ABPG72_010144 [Tetrahymena utriculariae]